MTFDSLQFFVFFIIILGLYFKLGHKNQNWLLLAASCVFYATWDWRFLSLIFISIITDYFCALKIYETNNERRRKSFLLLSIFINFSILGFFKYYNFFTESLQIFLNYFGIVIQTHLLNLILPLGISYYTFKTLSYTFDVYKKAMEPTKNFFDYALFVIFFPQIIAGPIMRAKDLLPQIGSPRNTNFDKIYNGFWRILWGLIQKVFIANKLAIIAKPVFASNPPYQGHLVILAVYAFSFQIYFDFAGYTDIAIGIGNCMGFKTNENFNMPYLSTNPADFWRRWHITLSTWLRDYLYTPIVFCLRYWGNIGIVLAFIITFTLCGLWHGPKWTFIVWGAYYGILLSIYQLLRPFLKMVPLPKNIFFEKTWYFLKVAFFFQFICIGWIFFWSKSLSQAFSMLKSIIFSF